MCSTNSIYFQISQSIVGGIHGDMQVQHANYTVHKELQKKRVKNTVCKVVTTAVEKKQNMEEKYCVKETKFAKL